MQFTHLFTVLSLAAVARADCDSDVTTANAVLFTQACMNDLQGGDRLSYATVFEDYRSNANTIYKYGLCGSTTCKDEVAASNYPTCAVTSATSYTAEVAGLATACGTLDTAVAANGGTCTEAQIADNIWAKHVVVLDSACATGISATAGSSWYTVFQTLDTATPSTLTDYCATSACVDLATTTKAKLASCTDGTDSNKDLYAAVGDVITYCNTPTTTAAPTTTATTTAAPTTTATTTAAPTTTATTTVAPGATTTTAAPTTTATTTAAPAATTTVAPTTTTAAPTPTPTKSSATTVGATALVTLAVAVMAL
ncbi:hypothetical protein H310_08112 [Aphanomyces invadans]|uniref:Secreted protein n=1 Tax=Aphanomyces invadans TaxID=157072 RepID=A0A024U0M8_9STRA|nr:hypothetical protein H310_08112 [Aphanomyces invadans]ETV99416.1 hypothetical protein H310_08112 [Aphanomyces invadans]|eukprot:XP_008871972.1 hypothetical protein H310_08112 [Aphanomyces invadans]